MIRRNLRFFMISVTVVVMSFGSPSLADDGSRSIWRVEKPKLELLGTVMTKRSGGTAIIVNNQSGKVALVSLNDDMEGWTVAGINLGHVTLVKNGEKFRLDLTKKWPERLIQRVNDEVSLVNTSLLNEALQTRGLNGEWGKLRVSPRLERGKVSGWKVETLLKGSLLKEVGIREGDVVLSINGKNINSFQEGFSLVNALRKTWREDPRLEILLERQGQPQTLVYLLN